MSSSNYVLCHLIHLQGCCYFPIIFYMLNLLYRMRRFGQPTAALLLAPAEGWGALWAQLGAFGPLSLLHSKKNKKKQDGCYGPKMAVSNKYGSN